MLLARKQNRNQCCTVTMKHRETPGTSPDEERKHREETKPFPTADVETTCSSTTRTNTFPLLDLSDNLLGRIYSQLTLTERQISRQVCRKLLKIVDESTPGADGLWVTISLPCKYSEDEKFRLKDKGKPIVQIPVADICVRQRLDSCSSEQVDLDIYLNEPLRRKDMLCTLLSSLPPLRSIRPKLLQLSLGERIGRGDLFALLLQHMVKQQVARSVETIVECHTGPKWNKGADPLAHVLEARAACLEFDRMSQKGVLSLEQHNGRPDLFLQVVPDFPRLVSLKFSFEHCRNIHLANMAIDKLAPLSSHPTLHQIHIDDSYGFFDTMGPLSNAINTKLMNTLATFTSLRKLQYKIYTYFMFNEDPDGMVAFGNMLKGMTKLVSLTMPLYHAVKLWGYLRDNKIVSSSLQELKIVGMCWCPRETKEEMSVMASNLAAVFPSLRTLMLDGIAVIKPLVSDETVTITTVLRPLLHHPSLTMLQIGDEKRSTQEEDWVIRVQEALGKKIEVTLCKQCSPHY